MKASDSVSSISFSLLKTSSSSCLAFLPPNTGGSCYVGGTEKKGHGWKHTVEVEWDASYLVNNAVNWHWWFRFVHAVTTCFTNYSPPIVGNTFVFLMYLYFSSPTKLTYTIITTALSPNSLCKTVICWNGWVLIKACLSSQQIDTLAALLCPLQIMIMIIMIMIRVCQV